MITEERIRQIAGNMDLSIEVALRHGNKKHASELTKAQLILNRLSNHIGNLHFGVFNSNDFTKHIEDSLQ